MIYLRPLELYPLSTGLVSMPAMYTYCKKSQYMNMIAARLMNKYRSLRNLGRGNNKVSIQQQSKKAVDVGEARQVALIDLCRNFIDSKSKIVTYSGEKPYQNHWTIIKILRKVMLLDKRKGHAMRSLLQWLIFRSQVETSYNMTINSHGSLTVPSVPQAQPNLDSMNYKNECFYQTLPTPDQSLELTVTQSVLTIPIFPITKRVLKCPEVLRQICCLYRYMSAPKIGCIGQDIVECAPITGLKQRYKAFSNSYDLCYAKTKINRKQHHANEAFAKRKKSRSKMINRLAHIAANPNGFQMLMFH